MFDKNARNTLNAQLESPVRRPRRGHLSPAIPGGLALNSPQNNHATIGDFRDNNRVAGFGPGMASALIGNNNRMSGGRFIMQSASPRRDLGTIGWGTNNPKLDQGVKRRILPEMNHKKAFDFGGLKDLPQMNTMGYQS